MFLVPDDRTWGLLGHSSGVGANIGRRAVSLSAGAVGQVGGAIGPIRALLSAASAMRGSCTVG